MSGPAISKVSWSRFQLDSTLPLLMCYHSIYAGLPLNNAGGRKRVHYWYLLSHKQFLLCWTTRFSRYQLSVYSLIQKLQKKFQQTYFGNYSQRLTTKEVEEAASAKKNQGCAQKKKSASKAAPSLEDMLLSIDLRPKEDSVDPTIKPLDKYILLDGWYEKL